MSRSVACPRHSDLFYPLPSAEVLSYLIPSRKAGLSLDNCTHFVRIAKPEHRV